MNNNTELLHEGDDLVLTEEFNFSESMFDLNETTIPSLNGDFSTVAGQISHKLKNYGNLLKLAHINARSIPKHAHEIDKILQDCCDKEVCIDVLGVCETFISPNTPENTYKIPGYNITHVDRDLSCRGGVALYVSEKLDFKPIKLPVKLVQPEMVFIEVTVGKIKVALGVIYKSPLIPYSVFASIHENLVSVTSKYEHCIIMGDCNIDFLKPTLAGAKFFTSYVTEPFALTQMIEEPTRITSHSSTLIDLMLTSTPENVKAHGVVDTPGISDHCLTFMAYSIKKNKV